MVRRFPPLGNQQLTNQPPSHNNTTTQQHQQHNTTNESYPFDLPTEAFSFDLFRQAFAAVQASTVHLQGVEQTRRFALVPLE